jgi:hypothetical protein
MPSVLPEPIRQESTGRSVRIEVIRESDGDDDLASSSALHEVWPRPTAGFARPTQLGDARDCPIPRQFSTYGTAAIAYPQWPGPTE